MSEERKPGEKAFLELMECIGMTIQCTFSDMKNGSMNMPERYSEIYEMRKLIDRTLAEGQKEAEKDG